MSNGNDKLLLIAGMAMRAQIQNAGSLNLSEPVMDDIVDRSFIMAMKMQAKFREIEGDV